MLQRLACRLGNKKEYPRVVLLALLLMALGLWFAWWLIVQVPYEMANDRNREGIAWVIVSIVGSPILAILALWLLGSKYDEAQ